MGAAAARVTLQRLADMRYVGQGHQIVVPLPEGEMGPQHRTVIEASFEQVYRQLYGRALDGVPIEGITWRLTALGQGTSLDLRAAHALAAASAVAPGEKRAAYLPEAGEFVEVPVHNRYDLRPGSRFAGPAIVEERESTVVVGQHGHCTVDAHGNLRITLVAG
jgi:N-methylhydantoinase A